MRVAIGIMGLNVYHVVIINTFTHTTFIVHYSVITLGLYSYTICITDVSLQYSISFCYIKHDIYIFLSFFIEILNLLICYHIDDNYFVGVTRN